MRESLTLDLAQRFRLQASASEELPPLELSLNEFIGEAWKVLEPDTVFQPNWHIQYISEYLQEVSAGRITRLIINMPPRHMKSILVSVMWPCWEWITRPEKRWIFVSYVDDLALKHSVDRRTLMASDWYQRNWARSVTFTRDQNQKTRFSNLRRGEMTAASVGGRLTGLGGNRIVIDDPLNPVMAASDTDREKVIKYYRETLHNRLDQPKTDAMVLVMQRLHEEDLTGFILETEGEAWTHLKVPSIAEEKETIFFPVTRAEKIREEGELLWPERMPAEIIEKERVVMGPLVFPGQHQQSPVGNKGGLVKDTYWRWYNPKDREKILSRMDELVIFADTATSAKESADYSVFAVWALLGREGWGLESGFYCLDVWEHQVDWPDLKKQAVLQWVQWQTWASAMVVEDKSSGRQVVQELLAETTIPVEAWEPGSKDKVQRLTLKTGYLESGKAHLPTDAPWLNRFLGQHRRFPKDKNDDMVDTTTMMLYRFSERLEGNGWGAYEPGELAAFFRSAGNIR